MPLQVSLHYIQGQFYYLARMTYTLLFGNNFISDNPKSVKCSNTTLFDLGEDSNGPYLTATLNDLSGKHVMLSIDKNSVLTVLRNWF